VKVNRLLLDTAFVLAVVNPRDRGLDEMPCYAARQTVKMGRTNCGRSGTIRVSSAFDPWPNRILWSANQGNAA
jgi:hypothetical protein